MARAASFTTKAEAFSVIFSKKRKQKTFFLFTSEAESLYSLKGGEEMKRFFSQNWSHEHPLRRQQLLRRLLPLLVASLFSFVALLGVSNRMVRQELNDSTIQGLTNRFSGIVDGYFAPLFRFLSSSAFWASLGGIDSLERIETSLKPLQHSLESLGSVSSFSLVDPSGEEWSFVLLENGNLQWKESLFGATDSEVQQRPTMALKEDESLVDYGYDFALSSPYELPFDGGWGLSLYGVLHDGKGKEGIQVWLDLPVERMKRWLVPFSDLPETKLFFLLPGEQPLLFSVSELLELTTGATELEGENAQIHSAFLSEILSTALNTGEGPQQISILWNDQVWRGDFRALNAGADPFTVGVLVPIDDLWPSQFTKPLQGVLSLFFIIPFGFFIAILTDFFRKTHQSSEWEILQKKIVQGESSRLEFKSSLRWDYRLERPNKDLEAVILKSVAAFSNGGGGTLLIGISDDGETLGLQSDYACLKDQGKDYFELHLRSLLITQYGLEFVNAGLRIDFPSWNGQEICRIEIRKGKQPVFTKISGKGNGPQERFFVRSGNSSRSLDSHSEVLSYVRTRFGHHALS